MYGASAVIELYAAVLRVLDCIEEVLSVLGCMGGAS